MKKILFIYSIIITYAITSQPDQVKQGIAGKIYLKQGNFMPSPGRKANTGKPVSTAVFVYQLTGRGQAIANGSYFDHIQTKLIAKAQSNDEGNYAIALPPGNYSVFVGNDNRLYANSFDSKGNINPIEVTKDSVSKMDIIMSNKAVY
jgi:hypothetical protein